MGDAIVESIVYNWEIRGTDPDVRPNWFQAWVRDGDALELFRLTALCSAHSNSM